MYKLTISIYPFQLLLKGIMNTQYELEPILAPQQVKKKGVRFGSIVLGLIVVFGLGTLLVLFAYKGKKVKAKQRKNDQKNTLKTTAQTDKLGNKNSKRTRQNNKQDGKTGTKAASASSKNNKQDKTNDKGSNKTSAKGAKRPPEANVNK